jgi:hypothetical protein
VLDDVRPRRFGEDDASDPPSDSVALGVIDVDLTDVLDQIAS